MSIRKNNRAKVYNLWSKGICKQEIASKLGLTLNYVEKLFTQFYYHSVVNNGRDFAQKKADEIDFILCSEDLNVWQAYEKMVNPH